MLPMLQGSAKLLHVKETATSVILYYEPAIDSLTYQLSSYGSGYFQRPSDKTQPYSQRKWTVVPAKVPALCTCLGNAHNIRELWDCSSPEVQDDNRLWHTLQDKIAFQAGLQLVTISRVIDCFALSQVLAGWLPDCPDQEPISL